jgi:uncharacterized repeat protein (TIGR01451 family)
MREKLFPQRCLWVLLIAALGVAGLVGTPADARSAERAVPAVPQQDVAITVDTVVVSGLDHPVQVTHAGDGSGRLFVVEQPGRLRVVRDGTLLSTAFLDLRSQVGYGGERGLLGLAFHPNYAKNGYFYVNYTRAGDGATVIARYTVSASDPDVADPASVQTLLTISQPYGNHNGGQVLFGPDGYLYVGMGDGGSGGDPLNNGQDKGTLLGAMLRLDVDGGTPYAIPPDNPYVGQAGRDEIWAIGLRNPWRFSFDRLTGDLYIGDVGQNEWEEISYQAAGTAGGVNFGWRCKEGTHLYNFSGVCDERVLTDPIAEYGHDVGRSVTGGFVYRGLAFPNLVGRYFYADYVEGKIWSLYQTGADPVTWSAPALELDVGFNVSAFGEDEEGELYVVDWSGGTIRLLADVEGPVANLSTSRKRAAEPALDPGEVMTYTVALVNTGGLIDGVAHVTDTVPAGLSYVPGSLAATLGTGSDALAPTLTWRAPLSVTRRISITYRATATGGVTGSLVNTATVSGAGIDPLTLRAAVIVPRSAVTSTMRDFFLPGTQPEQLTDELVSAVDCNICHSAPIYDAWRGSMMSQSGRDPLVWAAIFAANADAPGSGDYCLRCHVSKGWLEGRSHPADGSALRPQDIADGVACSLCHRMVDPVPSLDDEAAALDLAIRDVLTAPVPADYVGSSTLIVDPADNRRGPFSFEDLPYHTAYRTDFLGQGGDPITEARLCGTCHNLDNPLLAWDETRGQYWPNEMGAAAETVENGALFPVERTFDEWLYSAYARGGVYAPRLAGSKPSGVVRDCQDCHLTRDTGTAADPAFNPVTRDCRTTGCLPEHTLVGGNTWVQDLLQDPAWRLSVGGQAAYLEVSQERARDMLRKAATMTVTLAAGAGGKEARVRVYNHTGHKLPTGYPEGRLLWINLRAYDAGDALVYESGAYDPASGVLTRDADVQVYEVKQGITPELAAYLGRPAGASFHFVLNNTVVKDNRIPPRGYTQALYDRPGLRPVGAIYADGQYWADATYALPAEAERVAATLYYQVASKAYVDFLETWGGVDGADLAALWERTPTPAEVVATAWTPSQAAYLPLVLR